MKLFEGGYFFYTAVLISVPAIILGIRERNIKVYGFIASVIIILMTLYKNPQAIVYLAVYVIYEYSLLVIYRRIRRNRQKRGYLYPVFLFLTILPLFTWKLTGFFGKPFFAVIGLSYMTFKTVELLIETEDGFDQDMGFLDFVYFLIFFPCISSGPIDRSRRFIGDLEKKISREEYLELLGNGLSKILLGLIYKFICGAGIFQAMTWLGNKGTFSSNLIYMYSYGGYLFFDFAGYSLMAIGFSYIFGIATPENFNKPFLATDMKDFWSRWHMTLSFWFRDFVFSRMMMRAIKGKWFSDKLIAASFAFMINMGLMGLWHGLEGHYIVYGLYHGALLSLTEVYQKKSAFHKKYKKNKAYRMVSRLITIQMVFFGFLIFSGKLF
jgi:membrane protein involved in D-alanine export